MVYCWNLKLHDIYIDECTFFISCILAVLVGGKGSYHIKRNNGSTKHWTWTGIQKIIHCLLWSDTFRSSRWRLYSNVPIVTSQCDHVFPTYVHIQIRGRWGKCIYCFSKLTYLPNTLMPLNFRYWSSIAMKKNYNTMMCTSVPVTNQHWVPKVKYLDQGNNGNIVQFIWCIHIVVYECVTQLWHSLL